MMLSRGMVLPWREFPTCFQRRAISADRRLLSYFPLTGGPELENVTEIWSTWRFEYTEAETDKMISLAKGECLFFRLECAEPC